MITVEKPNTVQTHGIKDTVSFGIKQEGLAHIFSVLRNQLYSDKILAVIREYSTNGVDAHVEIGKGAIPIEVTLPSRFSSTFKVRDFGSGLSDTDIHDIYAFYGESTKRKSNQMIGQLGLGSKSAFAYGDNFVITSFVDGIKNTYNAFIDASQIGQIAKLASEPTNEQNGVEISFAVKDYDLQSFHDKAYNLFRYFKVRPVVHGAKFDYAIKTPIMKGTDWAIYGQSSSSVAIMGNIGYPIDNHFNDQSITNALACGLEVDFAIGDLEISASREKLQYTDRTKKAIKDKLTRIVAEVAAELNSRFKSCATMFDAHKLYGTIMDYGSNLYMLREMVKNNLAFNGKAITSSSVHYTEVSDGSYGIRQYEKTWRGNKIKSYSYSRIECSDKTVLIDNDLDISSGITNRVYNLVNADKKVYVLSYRTAKDKQTFLTDSGLVDSNFIKLSSLPKVVLSTASGNVVKNTKHTSKEFVYDFTYAAKHSWTRKHSNYWTQEVVDVDNDAGIYLIIDTFKYQTKQGGLSDPSELANIVDSMKTFGIALPKIYGFKLAKRDAVKKNKNMVSLWDYIADELTKYFAANKVAQKVANRLEFDANGRSNWMEFILKNGNKADKKTVLFKVAELATYMKSEADRKILDAAMNWKEYFNATEKPEHKMEKLIAEVDSTYPLFSSIGYWHNMMNKSKAQDALIHYVNLIDG